MALTYPPDSLPAHPDSESKLRAAYNAQRRLRAAIAGLPRHAQEATELNVEVLTAAAPEDRQSLGGQMYASFAADTEASLDSLASLLQILAPALSLPDSPVTAADIAARLQAKVTE